MFDCELGEESKEAFRCIVLSHVGETDAGVAHVEDGVDITDERVTDNPGVDADVTADDGEDTGSVIRGTERDGVIGEGDALAAVVERHGRRGVAVVHSVQAAVLVERLDSERVEEGLRLVGGGDDDGCAGAFGRGERKRGCCVLRVSAGGRACVGAGAEAMRRTEE